MLSTCSLCKRVACCGLFAFEGVGVVGGVVLK